MAPTSTKRSTSEATHSLEYFPESRTASSRFRLCSPSPRLITASRPEKGSQPFSPSSTDTRRKERLSSTTTFAESLM